MTFDDELVQVVALLDDPRAWPKSASSASARMKSTEWPARMLAEPKHWASMLLPTPLGTHEHHMLLARQELQGEDLLELAMVASTVCWNSGHKKLCRLHGSVMLMPQIH